MLEARHSPVRARRITGEDGPLLRMLMLEASRPARCHLEHWFFGSHSAARWSALAEEKALSDRHTIFVLAADGAAEGSGVMWCLANQPGQTANLGWTWITPDLSGTALEVSLVEVVSLWAGGRGAVSLTSAADDADEAELLERAGFTRVGLAADGVRPVFVRSCPTASRLSGQRRQ